MVAFAVALAFRLITLGVTEAPGGDLRVRNNFSTRILRRADVEQFRPAGTRTGPLRSARTVQALLTDGTMYGIDVARSNALARGRRSDRDLALLRSWLHPN